LIDSYFSSSLLLPLLHFIRSLKRSKSLTILPATPQFFLLPFFSRIRILQLELFAAVKDSLHLAEGRKGGVRGGVGGEKIFAKILEDRGRRGANASAAPSLKQQRQYNPKYPRRIQDHFNQTMDSILRAISGEWLRFPASWPGFPPGFTARRRWEEGGGGGASLIGAQSLFSTKNQTN